MSLQPTRGQLKIWTWAMLSIASIGLAAVVGTVQAMLLAVGQYYDNEAVLGLSPSNFSYTMTYAAGDFLFGTAILLLSFFTKFRKKPYFATVLAMVAVIILVLVQWLFWAAMASV